MNDAKCTPTLFMDYFEVSSVIKAR